MGDPEEDKGEERIFKEIMATLALHKESSWTL